MDQMLEPEMIDTSEYAKEGPYTFCFSNAGVNNPWRVVGYDHAGRSRSAS